MHLNDDEGIEEKEQVCFSDPLKQHYYCTKGSGRIGGKILPGGIDTDIVCAVWYYPGYESEIVPSSDAIEKMNTVAKLFVTICRDCFEKGFLVETTGDMNYLQKTMQAEKEHEKNVGRNLRSGCRKRAPFRVVSNN